MSRPDPDLMPALVTVERTYAASPEQIWKAWTDPAILARWYGCDSDHLWRIHRWQPEPGGALEVSMDFDDETIEVSGTFLDVEAPTRLRFTFGDVDQIVTVTITPNRDGSHVLIEHAGLPPERLAMVDAGWTHCLGALLNDLGIST